MGKHTEATYVLIADRLEQASRRASFVRRRGPAPDYDDAQIVTIALATDFWFSGDEEKTQHFLWQYLATLWSSGIPSTSRFNVRRRELIEIIEAVRRQLRDEWHNQRREAAAMSTEERDTSLEERIHLVDSAPVTLTSQGRGGRNPTIEPEHRSEWFGVRTSRHFKFFGGRLHATVDLDQMLDEWVLAPRSYTDLSLTHFVRGTHPSHLHRR